MGFVYLPLAIGLGIFYLESLLYTYMIFTLFTLLLAILAAIILCRINWELVTLKALRNARGSL